MSDYLTEEERELKRLSEVACRLDGKGQARFLSLDHFHAYATPSAVLALLARIEALTSYADERERLWRTWAESRGHKDAAP